MSSRHDAAFTPQLLETKTVAHGQIADTACMQAGHTASVIPDGVIKVYFFNVQIGDLDERAILPRMSSYRVLQYDYMRTLVLL